MIIKNIFNKTLILAITFITGSSMALAPYTAHALSEEQKRIYSKGIYSYDFAVCEAKASENAVEENKQNDTDAKSMTLREQIGQLMFVGVKSKSDAVNIVKKYNVGGIMLVNEGDSLFSKDALKEVAEAGDTAPIIASDEEGGKVQRLRDKTGSYPSAKELGKKSDSEVEKIAKEYGDKLSDIGVNVNYAPVADIDNGSNDVISDLNRAFSSDPEKVADKAGAFGKGMRKAGVIPVYKHFPGHGQPSVTVFSSGVGSDLISSILAREAFILDSEIFPSFTSFST